MMNKPHTTLEEMIESLEACITIMKRSFRPMHEFDAIVRAERVLRKAKNIAQLERKDAERRRRAAAMRSTRGSGDVA